MAVPGFSNAMFFHFCLLIFDSYSTPSQLPILFKPLYNRWYLNLFVGVFHLGEFCCQPFGDNTCPNKNTPWCRVLLLGFIGWICYVSNFIMFLFVKTLWFHTPLGHYNKHYCSPDVLKFLYLLARFWGACAFLKPFLISLVLHGLRVQDMRKTHTQIIYTWQQKVTHKWKPVWRERNI